MSASHGLSFLAPAKLNISLKVFGRRPDGYHNIRTVMVPVTLYDEVTVEEAPSGISVEANDPGVPADARNICHKAAALFMERAGAPRGVRIRIRKRIPREAGLGGGSSDAAATLKGLLALTEWNPPGGAMMEIASRVGADVPFFALGRPALAEGFGDVLTPVRWDVPFFAAIVKPPFGLPTREGYERLGRGSGGPPGRLKTPSFRTWDDVAGAVENDFEAAWGNDRPEIGRIKEGLRAAGAEGAGLTGSGSAVFGLFRTETEARRALGALPPEDGLERFLARNI
ncbi:MAG: 4-(cytidine 5'-diphospho)-2-C-methyl-D-erythritol kinase [Deltaproteobacteria bacterium]|nr:4-(cytidine 5'-diphospho)-2-C-methyl-D-erythritol kinase [Deltaproteobacteria bacterium]